MKKCHCYYTTDCINDMCASCQAYAQYVIEAYEYRDALAAEMCGELVTPCHFSSWDGKCCGYCAQPT